MIDHIKSTYKNCESRVQTSAGVTTWFSVNSGVRQGSVLSPLLFAVVMDDIMRKVDSEGDATTSRTMIYADDVLI
jgi:Reverse transcriptase (RNA-dependent DNA polymerase)